MTVPTNILVVEDAKHDYELIVHELERSGIRCTTLCIDDPTELEQVFQSAAPDIVLCDHRAAQWDSLTVLAQVRDRDPAMPFVIVSGAMEESMELKAIASGVDDYVLKHRLAELGPAVRRALRLGEERRGRLRAEAERDRLRRQVEVLQRQSHPPATVAICTDCKRVLDRARQWTRLESYFGAAFGLRFSHALCPQCVGKYYTDIPRPPEGLPPGR